MRENMLESIRPAKKTRAEPVALSGAKICLIAFSAWCLAITLTLGAEAQDASEPYTSGKENPESRFLETYRNTPASMLDLGMVKLESRLQLGLSARNKSASVKTTRASVFVDGNSLTIDVYVLSNDTRPPICEQIWMSVRSVAADMSEADLAKSTSRAVCLKIAEDFASASNSELEPAKIVLDPMTDPCAALSIIVRMNDDTNDKKLQCFANFYDKKISTRP